MHVPSSKLSSSYNHHVILSIPVSTVMSHFHPLPAANLHHISCHLTLPKFTTVNSSTISTEHLLTGTADLTLGSQSLSAIFSLRSWVQLLLPLHSCLLVQLHELQESVLSHTQTLPDPPAIQRNTPLFNWPLHSVVTTSFSPSSGILRSTSGNLTPGMFKSGASCTRTVSNTTPQVQTCMTTVGKMQRKCLWIHQATMQQASNTSISASNLVGTSNVTGWGALSQCKGWPKCHKALHYTLINALRNTVHTCIHIHEYSLLYSCYIPKWNGAICFLEQPDIGISFQREGPLQRYPTIKFPN